MHVSLQPPGCREAFDSGHSVERKRRARRRELNRVLRWWYDEDHPMVGLRALCVVAVLVAGGAVVLSGQLVSATVCVRQLGCVIADAEGIVASGDTGPVTIGR